MKTAVLIVAAGRGARAGGDLPKQYRTICGEPVLTRTLKSFLCREDIDEILVAIHQDDVALFESATAILSEKVSSVFGGETRTGSVHAGLKELAKTKPDIVLIHDAARPFVSDQVIDGVIAKLAEYDSALPGIPVTDALKTADGAPVDRAYLYRAQTPQGFKFDKILAAFDDLSPDDSFADDIEVARNAGLSIGFSQGDEANFKLTHAQDFKRAEKDLRMINVTGSGYDVHKVTEGDHLWLCGVKIPAEYTLEGHSDADVGLHALTDALLGAISAGDIGDHFPPSDPQWKGAASYTFLEHARNLITAHEGVIYHVDVTLICEAPKIKPHREAMRTRVAEILDISVNRVSVKATTTEGLGFTGRREGIAAQAIANVRIPDV
ncbi:MAG: bifunctional 2-C-methyl-D-erythritol 4-phosphate cytidylyltransferase/2-C-methyl-D-erythritol 2,4-cyclodiphosphate synthase [Acidimicrobiales bacterium]|nr:bifunctional 2-C-methyl-D-erythritol 4-phosphate cytidylyltransferase/2-C-methyl-D-erythritol 2,4-cyclodiphosphate synthase [Hyphomonadaceae bacterium]RZV35552.1 MAG: bifunctional 2-C-methyl-D-erythritol 4-phosphate cytidylyltransferase/2-C-methyl-D-erythritol 2,4-cyclodiphosphate synthase [Acidimicrobiales bacterium]